MPFQILALSGGGYRGLFSAHILAKLEEQAGRPIGECFDLIAGTSIGGIIATGLALGKPAKQIRDVFEQKGEDIFTRGEPTWNPITNSWRFLRGIVKPKYDGTELRKAIESVVGVDTVIGDAKTRLLVPTVNMTKGSVQLFKTAHHPNFINDYKVKATDVAMATSAAPTFFPMAKIGASYFVDGGVVANAPDLCAIHEATHFLGIEIDEIRVLSIGTITTGFSLPASLGGRFGTGSWMKNQRLISTIFSSQQQLVDVMVRHRLGRHYLRMDDQPGLEQSSDLGLDIASKKRRDTLLGMADGVHQQFGGSAEIREMLDHQPVKPTFYKDRKPLL